MSVKFTRDLRLYHDYNNVSEFIEFLKINKNIMKFIIPSDMLTYFGHLHDVTSLMLIPGPRLPQSSFPPYLDPGTHLSCIPIGQWWLALPPP